MINTKETVEKIIGKSLKKHRVMEKKKKIRDEEKDEKELRC